MTAEESVRFYEQQQEYRQRREEFNAEIADWLEHHIPRNAKPKKANPNNIFNS